MSTVSRSIKCKWAKLKLELYGLRRIVVYNLPLRVRYRNSGFVAQSGRAFDSRSKGCRFESCRGHAFLFLSNTQHGLVPRHPRRCRRRRRRPLEDFFNRHRQSQDDPLALKSRARPRSSAPKSGNSNWFHMIMARVGRTGGHDPLVSQQRWQSAQHPFFLGAEVFRVQCKTQHFHLAHYTVASLGGLNRSP